jgi:hypothetical protein
LSVIGFFSVFSTPTSVSIAVFLKTDFSVSVTDPALAVAYRELNRFVLQFHPHDYVKFNTSVTFYAWHPFPFLSLPFLSLSFPIIFLLTSTGQTG